MPLVEAGIRITRYSSSMWTGDYARWCDVRPLCQGYQSEGILRKCHEALRLVRAGQAKYERDSLLFNDSRLCWELLTVAERVAAEEGRLSVLDFGGALGSVYYQHRSWLDRIPDLRWHVVEQAQFVEVGKTDAADGRLHFFHTIEESMASDAPNLILLSGVTQYLDDPYAWISRFNAIPEIAFIVLERVPIIKDGRGRDMLTKQTVAPHIYESSYPSWFFHEPGFLAAFDRYQLVAEYPSRFDDDIWVNGLRCTWKGFVLAPRVAATSAELLTLPHRIPVGRQ